MKHLPAQDHGSLERVFDDIWCVRGASKSMTVLRDPQSGELTLINAMRLSDASFAELQALGKIANVMTLGAFHGKDDGFFREAFGARVYALEGHVYQRGVSIGETGTAGYLEPDERLAEDSTLPVRNASLKFFRSSKQPEALLVIDREGGILVSADALHNTPAPDQFVSRLGRTMMKRAGFAIAYNVGPGWLRSCSPTVSDVRSILDLEFEHVLPGHGAPVIGDAKSKYRPVLEGELRGARS